MLERTDAQPTTAAPLNATLRARAVEAPLLAQRRVEAEAAREEEAQAEVRRRLVLKNLARFDTADVVAAVEESMAAAVRSAVAAERTELAAHRELAGQATPLFDELDRLAGYSGALGAVLRAHQAADAVRDLGAAELSALAAPFEPAMALLSDLVMELEVWQRGGDPPPLRERLAAAQAMLDAAAEPLRAPDEGLVAALRALGRRAAIAVRVSGVERPLPAPAQQALLHIATLAVDNAQRHAQAQRIELVLAFAPQRVCLLVSDDGQGFDAAGTELRLRGAGSGLVRMRARAAAAGALLTVHSAPGAGTEVRVSLAA